MARGGALRGRPSAGERPRVRRSRTRWRRAAAPWGDTGTAIARTLARLRRATSHALGRSGNSESRYRVSRSRVADGRRPLRPRRRALVVDSPGTARALLRRHRRDVLDAARGSHGTVRHRGGARESRGTPGCDVTRRARWHGTDGDPLSGRAFWFAAHWRTSGAGRRLGATLPEPRETLSPASPGRARRRRDGHLDSPSSSGVIAAGVLRRTHERRLGPRYVVYR